MSIKLSFCFTIDGGMQIFAEYFDNSIITLDVESFDTIGSIKAKICDVKGLPTYEQKLMFENSVLHASQTIADYEITQGSTITVQMHVDCPRYDISVKMPDGETVTVYSVGNWYTIHDIKCHIEATTGISAMDHFLLSQDEEVLDDRLTCNISFDTIVYLVPSLLVIIKCLSEETFTMTVRPENTVLDLKTEIARVHDLSIDCQILVLGNLAVLDDDDALVSNYAMRRDVTIYLNQRPSCINIMVKMLTGKLIPLSVYALSAVIDLKYKIQACEGITPCMQRFIFNRRILNDEEILDDLGITSQSTIHLVLNLVGGCQMFCRYRDKTITVDFNPYTYTIYDIKQRLQDREGIELHHQVLLFNGLQLRDNGKIAIECGIGKEVALDLVVRRRIDFPVVVKTFGSKKETMIEVRSTDRISTLTALIREKTGILSQCLFLDSELLIDNYTLAEYGILSSSYDAIFYQCLPQYEMRISVRTMINYQISFNVSSSTVIRDLLSQIINNNKMAVPPSKICLFYRGVPLSDMDKSVRDYNVIPDSTIVLAPHELNLQLLVRDVSGDMLSLCIAIFATVRWLKLMIAECIGVPACWVVDLCFKEKRMDDIDKMLYDYKVTSGSCIDYCIVKQNINSLDEEQDPWHVTVGGVSVVNDIPLHTNNMRPHVTVTQNQSLNPTSSVANIDLRKRGYKNKSLLGHFSYLSSSRTAVFAPCVDLEYGTIYDIIVKYDTNGIKIFEFCTVDKMLLLCYPCERVSHTCAVPSVKFTVEMLKRQCREVFNCAEESGDDVCMFRVLRSGVTTPIVSDEDMSNIQNLDVVLYLTPEYNITHYCHDEAEHFIKTDEHISEVPAEELELQRELHHGTYATVCLGTWRASDVVMKIIQTTASLTADTRDDLLAELKLLQQLRHPRILTLMGICHSYQESNIVLVTEYMTGGSLHSVLHDAEHALYGTLTSVKKFRIALDIACGMAFLHRSGVIHRDLKSVNVLLNENASITKVTAFSLSAARDVARARSFSDDVFRFGMLLWELITNHPLREDLLEVQVIEERGLLKEHILEGIVARCLKDEEDHRPTFADLQEELRRVLLVAFKDDITSAKNIPDCFICPIGFRVMNDPVICSDGFSYDRVNITDWLGRSSISPLTNLPLENRNLIPNRALKAAMESFLNKHAP